jgi:hypothetical protein
MAVGSTNPAVSLAGAEAAQVVRAVQQAQERTVNQVAAGQTQERSKEDVSELVRGTEQVEGSTIQGESRGAHSFLLTKDEEEKEETPPPPETPPDPKGRGSSLDLKA